MLVSAGAYNQRRLPADAQRFAERRQELVGQKHRGPWATRTGWKLGRIDFCNMRIDQYGALLIGSHKQRQDSSRPGIHILYLAKTSARSTQLAAQ